MRFQRAPVRIEVSRRASGQVNQSWRDVEQRGGGGDAAGRKAAGGVDDQRHARGVFKEAHLVPEPLVAQHFAVIGEHDDDGLLRKAAVAQRLHQAPDVVVDIGDLAIIGAAGGADLLVCQLDFVHRADMADALRMRVEPVDGDRRPRHVDVFVAVEVEIFPRDCVRVVRVRQRGDQQQRARVAAPRAIVDLAFGGEGHLVVEVQLVGAHGQPGLRDRTHVVIPVGALLRMIPIRRPTEIGGVDIGGQTLLEAVQLIRPAEMHLA